MPAQATSEAVTASFVGAVSADVSVALVDPGALSGPAQNGKPGKAQTLRNVKANQVLTVDVNQATETATLPPSLIASASNAYALAPDGSGAR